MLNFNLVNNPIDPIVHRLNVKHSFVGQVYSKLNNQIHHLLFFTDELLEMHSVIDSHREAENLPQDAQQNYSNRYKYICGWNDKRNSHKTKNYVRDGSPHPCAWYHRTTVFFNKVTFPNRSVLARVWSEVLWEETQCSLRILIPCLLWRPPCIPSSLLRRKSESCWGS